MSTIRINWNHYHPQLLLIPEEGSNITVAKLLLIPKLNANLARAMYLGFLLAIFIICTGMLTLRYFHADYITTIEIMAVFSTATFSYLVYQILEIQDLIESSLQKKEDGTNDKKGPSKIAS